MKFILTKEIKKENTHSEVRDIKVGEELYTKYRDSLFGEKELMFTTITDDLYVMPTDCEFAIDFVKSLD